MQDGHYFSEGRDLTGDTGRADVSPMASSTYPKAAAIRRHEHRGQFADGRLFAQASRPEIARDMERVYTTFPKLLERRDQAAATLSGGEQQMCAIGRGLMSAPRLLMIDELSLGLSPLHGRTIGRGVADAER